MGLPQGSAQCQQEIDRARRVFCADQNLEVGAACDQAIAQQEADARKGQQEFLRQEAAQTRTAKAMQNPLGGGILAAGMMASMVGAVALLLLAAGHVGNEWSAKTIKQVLTQEGRRWRVLATKLVSLWLLGIGLLVVLWAALAALAPIFASSYHLPGSSVSSGSALTLSLRVAWRALLVLAAFVVLGTLCAVVTRNTLGSFFLAFAFVIASQILAAYKLVGRFTLAYHVAGWMGFHSSDVAPNHLWRDDFYPLKFPTHTAGLIGLAVTIALFVILALFRLERSDVKV
jgi:ABC-type transport system involved in multi-copper enzyme maturation permease subunit